MKSLLESQSKKGQIGNLQGIIMVLVVVGILLGAVFFILDEFLSQAEDIDADGSAVTGINKTIEAMMTIPNLLGLIVLIAVIGIILAVVFNVIPGAGARR